MSKVISVLAAAVLAAVGASAAFAQQDVSLNIGRMTWRGNAAQAPVEIVNTTGAPLQQMEIACEFVAIGRVIGTDRQRIPALGAGARATVNVAADTGGQLIDSIRCRLL